MSDSFQGQIPKARINLRLDLHTGGAQKKTELPLKLLVVGDFSNGKETAVVSERSKENINKNNFNNVLNEYSPSVNLTVENTLAGDGSEENINLTFRDMEDFTPEQVAPARYPSLKLCSPCAVSCAASKPICWITGLSEKNWKTFCVTRHSVQSCAVNCLLWHRNRPEAWRITD